MRPYSLRVDHDDSDPNRFKVVVSYHERDTSQRLGQSADVVVYVEGNGRSLPESLRDISAEAVERAEQFMRSILGNHDA